MVLDSMVSHGFSKFWGIVRKQIEILIIPNGILNWQEIFPAQPTYLK